MPNDSSVSDAGRIVSQSDELPITIPTNGRFPGSAIANLSMLLVPRNEVACIPMSRDHDKAPRRKQVARARTPQFLPATTVPEGTVRLSWVAKQGCKTMYPNQVRSATRAGEYRLSKSRDSVPGGCLPQSVSPSASNSREHVGRAYGESHASSGKNSHRKRTSSRKTPCSTS